MPSIAAQVSLYPLRQARVGPAIEAAAATFARHGLRVDVGPMSTLLAGELDHIRAALHEAFATVTAQGEVVMVVTLSNGCPVPAPEQDTRSRR